MILSFISGEGGSGKTRILCEAAYTISNKGWRSVILVELDPVGNLNSLFGLAENTFGASDYLNNVVSLENIYLRRKKMTIITKGHARLKARISEVYKMLYQIKKQNPDNLIMVDTASGINNFSFGALSISDVVVIPTKGELSLVKQILFLREIKRFLNDSNSDPKIFLLVNDILGEALTEKEILSMLSGIKDLPDINLEYLPRSPEIISASKNLELCTEKYEAKINLEISKFCQKVLFGKVIETENKNKRFLEPRYGKRRI